MHNPDKKKMEYRHSSPDTNDRNTKRTMRFLVIELIQNYRNSLLSTRFYHAKIHCCHI